MINFKKIYNLKIISLTISISVLFTSTLYAYPSKDSLRVSVGKSLTYERMKSRMTTGTDTSLQLSDVKLLLIYPEELVSEVLGLQSLISVLRQAGYDPHFLSADDSTEKIDEEIKRADMVGISITSPTAMGLSKALVKRIKALREDIITIAGGPFATTMTDEVLRMGFDYCFIGESEVNLLLFMQLFESGEDLRGTPGIAYLEEGEKVVRTKPLDFIRNLDSLPLPARDIINYEQLRLRTRRLYVLPTRGSCPFRCTFCDKTKDKIFGKRIRAHSPYYVARDIEALFEAGWMGELFLYDDNIVFLGEKWFLELGDILRERGLIENVKMSCHARVDCVNESLLRTMQYAGIYLVGFGGESGSPKIRDFYNKGITNEQIIETFRLCHKIGLRTAFNTIVGAPIETKQDLEMTRLLLKEIGPTRLPFYLSVPLRGTPYYAWCLSHGYIDGSEPSLMDTTSIRYRDDFPLLFEPDHLTRKDLVEYRDELYNAAFYGYTKRVIEEERVSEDVNTAVHRLYEFDPLNNVHIQKVLNELQEDYPSDEFLQRVTTLAIPTFMGLLSASEEVLTLPPKTVPLIIRESSEAISASL